MVNLTTEFKRLEKEESLEEYINSCVGYEIDVFLTRANIKLDDAVNRAIGRIERGMRREVLSLKQEVAVIKNTLANLKS